MFSYVLSHLEPRDQSFPLLNKNHKSHGVICYLHHHSCYICGWGKSGCSNASSVLQNAASGTLGKHPCCVQQPLAVASGCCNNWKNISRASSSTLVGDMFIGPLGSEKQFAYKSPYGPYNHLPTKHLLLLQWLWCLRA